jgi:predicted SAM-dependent methyltransferase
VSRARGERLLVNVGCGPEGSSLPAYFSDWRQLRVDSDDSVQPDVVTDLTDLSPIPDGSADAVWAAHCIEHLYEHPVAIALAEFQRVLRRRSADLELTAVARVIPAKNDAERTMLMVALER